MLSEFLKTRKCSTGWLWPSSKFIKSFWTYPSGVTFRAQRMRRLEWCGFRKVLHVALFKAEWRKATCFYCKAAVVTTKVLQTQLKEEILYWEDKCFSLWIKWCFFFVILLVLKHDNWKYVVSPWYELQAITNTMTKLYKGLFRDAAPDSLFAVLLYFLVSNSPKTSFCMSLQPTTALSAPSLPLASPRHSLLWRCSPHSSCSKSICCWLTDDCGRGSPRIKVLLQHWKATTSWIHQNSGRGSASGEGNTGAY